MPNRVFTPKDAHAIMNLMVHQMTGEQALTVFDTSSFADAGSTLITNYGTENVLNALGHVVGQMYMDVRPVEAKFRIIQALNTGMFTHILKKVSYYARDNQASGYFNTDLNTNLETGKGDVDGAGSQWEQNLPVVSELYWGGSMVWDTSTTVTEEQLKTAFRNESEFINFMSGVMLEKSNDIERTKQAFNELALNSRIVGQYAMRTTVPNACINLTEKYNQKFGTSYTSEQLRTTYLDSFLKFFTAEFKLASDKLTYSTKMYHWSPAKQIGDVSYSLLRNVPKASQKAFLYDPLLLDAKTSVLPEIFNPQYLDINNYEPVVYWQSFAQPSAIKGKTSIPNVANPSAGQVATDEVSLDYVVGCLFDEDALMTDFQLESVYSTEINARHGYRNLWYHFSKNIIKDYTHPFIIFYMAD